MYRKEKLEKTQKEYKTIKSQKIKIQENKKKIKRGKKTKHKETYLNMFSLNVNSLNKKIKSLKNELKRTNSSIFTLQETHYRTKGKVKIEDFEIFEAIRKHKEKGGTMVGAHKALKPVLINEYDDPFEMIVIEINIGNKEIRIITGYGPQETWTPEERNPFFNALEQEIVKAEMAGKSIIIESDFNSKLGKEFIPNDPNHQTPNNGKTLAGIIKRQNLVVLNGQMECEGTITRKRITTRGTEQSAISFVLVSPDLRDYFESMIIDEEREYAPTTMKPTKKGVEKHESDHNVLMTKFKIPWNKQIKTQTNDLFNLKNQECQKKFKEHTSNNNHLSKVFEENEDLDEAVSKFLKKMNKLLHKCFRKVRIKRQRPIEAQEKLYNRWREIKSKKDIKSVIETEEIENELANDYIEKIEKAAKDGESTENGFSSKKLWDLKKKLCPRSRDPPTAMLDPKGNLIKNEETIRELAINAFGKRLENKPIKEGLEGVKEMKEKLAEKLMKVAKNNKTPPWEIKDIEKVLKQLKKDKSRDPLGLANEIFRSEVAGDDLKKALLHMMNRIKSEQKYPKALELCNISSIWKKKGPRNNFDSYRGIFRVTIFRSILDRLIYNDEYSNLDKNLTDCNVGGRKFRNIRDNIFVMNAVLNSARKQTKEALDLQVYDVETCFDSLWLHEVINCLYEAGLRNDKLPLLFLENANAQVAVKISNGISNRKNIQNIIMQGSIWGSLCCVILMDKLGKLIYSKPELMYLYKGIVEVPTLQMVDDILGIVKCSPQSKQLNTVVNTFMESEKLTLSQKKCHKVHIGKEDRNCCDLKVHERVMHEASSEKYLGDIIHKSGKNKVNIEARISKGHNRVNTILAMLAEAPLGWATIKAGLRLRKPLLLNAMMFNSEAWHNFGLKDIEAFEQVDLNLLRGLVKGHAKIPCPAIYLELGQEPLRFIIASRRILYLHTLLTRQDTELTKKTYLAQKADPTKGDFCLLVEEDKKLIEMAETDDDIKKMTKREIRLVVKKKVKVSAFKFLTNEIVRKKLSKMKDLEYHKLKPEPYTISPKFTQKRASLLLAMRTRTVRGIRSDFGQMYLSKTCPLDGCSHLDTLPGLLTCPALMVRARHLLEHTQVKYTHVFSQVEEEQKAAVELYAVLLELREEILSPPTA